MRAVHRRRVRGRGHLAASLGGRGEQERAPGGSSSEDGLTEAVAVWERTGERTARREGEGVDSMVIPSRARQERR